MDSGPPFGPRAYIASGPLFRQRLLCGPDISCGHLTKRLVPTITNALSPSSIRLGRRPLKPLRRVQIPLVTPFSEDRNCACAITPFRGLKGIPSSLFCVWNAFYLAREDGLIVSGFCRPVVPSASLGGDMQDATDAIPAGYDQAGRKAFELPSGAKRECYPRFWGKERDQ